MFISIDALGPAEAAPVVVPKRYTQWVLGVSNAGNQGARIDRRAAPEMSAVTPGRCDAGVGIDELAQTLQSRQRMI